MIPRQNSTGPFISLHYINKHDDVVKQIKSSDVLRKAINKRHNILACANKKDIEYSIYRYFEYKYIYSIHGKLVDYFLDTL